MCGICGILSFDGAGPSVDDTLIDRMTAVLTHRGPDDSGTYCEGPIALGHRRLAVIDLSRNGRQPMCNEDRTVWIVYNGEVYNFRELKTSHRLVEKGHVFRSKTDTEVLVHLYEELGPAMVDELAGMFALAIWDARQRKLHLIRDRYGIKPLFYALHDNRLLFASEIKSILQAPQFPRRVNLQALHDFLTFDYVPGEQSMFDGIRAVPPAHRATATTDGRVTNERYWDLSFEIDPTINEREAVGQSFELLEHSVRQQLVADVPIGVLLSGGLDSSTLVALMSQRHAEPVRTYSIGFEDRSFNELPAARAISQAFGTVHREVIVTAGLVRELLPKCLSYVDEPYGDGSAIPTYSVCQLAKDDVVVLLSGEGGDETFVGYETYSAHKISRWFRKVPRWLRNGLIAPLVHRLKVSDKKLSFEFKAKRFLGGQDLQPAQAHLWWRIVLTEQEKQDLFAPEVLEQFTAEASDRFFQEVFRRDRTTSAGVLNRLLHIDSAVFMPNDLMVKNDRMSMAHSLEARVPFTDHQLTGFLARVPPSIKFPRLRKKHLLRRAMREHLPASILNRKKVGLEMPYSRWLKRELNDVLMNYCGPRRIVETGFFRPQSVAKLIDDHVSERRDNGRALWGLLNFMMWLEAYLS